MLRTVVAFFLGLVVAIGGALWLKPAFNLPVLRSHTETASVASVVSGMRGLNRLTVFRSYVMAVTEAKETNIIGMEARQVMITPAFVNYFVDFSRMQPSDVRLEGARLEIKLPQLEIERPNIDTLRIRSIDAGLWSSLSDADKRLWQRNQARTMADLFAQGKAPFLVKAARQEALEDVLSNTRKLLGPGGAGITIVAHF